MTVEGIDCYDHTSNVVILFYSLHVYILCSTRKFMTTPFPFPLVQMARTFLFFYIYTLPFALLSDTSLPLAHLFVIFMVCIYLVKWQMS
jgi:hypothetical protein